MQIDLIVWVSKKIHYLNSHSVKTSAHISVLNCVCGVLAEPPALTQHTRQKWVLQTGRGLDPHKAPIGSVPEEHVCGCMDGCMDGQTDGWMGQQQGI